MCIQVDSKATNRVCVLILFDIGVQFESITAWIICCYHLGRAHVF